MSQQRVEWIWLEASETVDTIELSRISGLSTADVAELVDYGALVPLAIKQPEFMFPATCVAPVRTVAKLRADFDLDLFTTGMLLGYVNQIGGLEMQLKTLRARLPAHGELIGCA